MRTRRIRCIFRRILSIFVLASGLLTPGLLSAQVEVQLPDRAIAVYKARAAAGEAPIGTYFVEGMLATPATLVSVLAVTLGSEPRPTMLIGPAALIGFTTNASRSELAVPARFESDLVGKDSTYITAYRQAYERQVKARRHSAIAFGGIVGVIGGYLGLLALFARGID